MRDLSEAVLHWLEYQRCIGIDQFLNESALTIPIVGYLTSEGWDTKKETDYSKICTKILRDKCFADFYFVRGDERLIVETKLFKLSAKNQIFDDLVRLVLPSEPSLKRFALVAFSKENVLWGPFKMLLELPTAKSVNLDPNMVTLRGAGEPIQLGYNDQKFTRLRAYTSEPLSMIEVTCDQRTESKKYAAIVLSVARKNDNLSV